MYHWLLTTAKSKGPRALRGWATSRAAPTNTMRNPRYMGLRVRRYGPSTTSSTGRRKQPIPRRNLRKIPVQERSKATADAIRKAALQVFSNRGYTRTTTTAVAERSGVSVGSLYQYFANKDALLHALWEVHRNEAHQLLYAELEADSLMRLSGPEVVRRLVGAMLDLHLAQPQLHRLLSENVPPGHPVSLAQRKHERAVFERAVALFASHPDLRGPNTTRTVLMMGRLLESFSHWYVIDQPPLGLNRNGFVDELTALALDCLRRGQRHR